MAIKDSRITAEIESDSELKTILHKVGNTYIPSGLSNEEILILSVYVRMRINGGPKSRYASRDTQDIYSYFGGNSHNLDSIIDKAESMGLIGSYLHKEEITQNTGIKIVGLNTIVSMRVPVISGTKGYEALQKILGKMGTGSERLIVAGTPFSSKMSFVEILNETIKDSNVSLVDTYLDSMTLSHFALMDKKPVLLRILTTNLPKTLPAFKKDIADFLKETSITLEIRISKDIHDRYLISGNEVLSLGGSLKDIGKKDTIITPIGNVKDTIIDHFKLRWDNAEPFEFNK